MEIHFCLNWLAPGRRLLSAFKSPEAGSLFQEYLKRISHFRPCSAAGGTSAADSSRRAVKVWVCDRATTARELSSEELARELEKELAGGTRRLEILIGGPDGFSRAELERLRPDRIWSFGRLTLPHELAAVVAGEQIYRALTILNRHPYHSGH